LRIFDGIGTNGGVEGIFRGKKEEKQHPSELSGE
jgi:hypothetical protein